MWVISKGYVPTVLALRYGKPAAIRYFLAVLWVKDHYGSSKTH